MAQIVHHHFADAALRIAHGIWNMVCTAAVAVPETLVTWQQRSETRAALTDLDDRLLRDMGIDRAAAHEEARRPFWKA